MQVDVRQFFAPDGPLARLLHPFEVRPAQLRVATAVAAALDAGASLIAEAGTGTGKTLAYLMPALASGRKVVVSTGTKNLQDQIVRKDLPLLERALGKRFVVEVMKGRANYLCEARAEEFFSQLILPTLASRRLADALQAWRERTQTGDRAELADLPDDAPVWRELSVTSEQCLGRACAHYERCWVTQMRRRAQTAALVIVNHHLYLADAAMRQDMGNEAKALLPAHDVVIFDEAHDLDEVAAQHFGHQVSERRLQELERDIGRAAVGQGLLPARLSPLLTELTRRSRVLFEHVPTAVGRNRLRPGSVTAAWADSHAAVDALLQQLESELAMQDDDALKVLAARTATLAAELAFVLDLPGRASAVTEVATQTAEKADVPYVRYSEANGRVRTLVARPVEVAPLLGQILRQRPAVFVSATLRVGQSFNHFRRTVGLGDAEELCVDSPFDYANQACLYLPTDLPEPDRPEFALEAADRSAQLVAASGGGAFVLCTSHRVLPLMRAALVRQGFGNVLVQGEAPRSHLIETFRRQQHGVLVATMSFWKGVDVPGDALRLVIMDRLPFASPADPVVEARLEQLIERGLEPFMAYQVPQAALMLRQGFGRLIRRQTDRGVVAILDTRLSTRRYGPLLLRSLPRCRRLRALDEVRQYFASTDAAASEASEASELAGEAHGEPARA